MSARASSGSFAPWAGLFLGAAAWFAQHQVCSATIYWDCRLGGPVLTAGVGLAAAVVTVAGGWMSWWTYRAKDRSNRSVSGAIGAGSAAIFLLAILFQSLIGFIVPACHR